MNVFRGIKLIKNQEISTGCCKKNQFRMMLSTGYLKNELILCGIRADHISIMNPDTEIPVPIRFNPLKHHRNYILDFLKVTSPDSVIARMDSICNSYTDIYTGMLDPVSIGNSVVDILKSKGVLQSDDFFRWVELKNGYRQIQLEDQSEWIVRKSTGCNRYIHLHPARNGRFSLRFKGSTLKTVCLLGVFYPDFQENISSEMLNRVRTQLGLSPLSRTDCCKGIIHCFLTFPELQS